MGKEKSKKSKESNSNTKKAVNKASQNVLEELPEFSTEDYKIVNFSKMSDKDIMQSIPKYEGNTAYFFPTYGSLSNPKYNTAQKYPILPKELSLDKLKKLNEISVKFDDNFPDFSNLKKETSYNFINRKFDSEDLYISTVDKININDELKEIKSSSQNYEKTIRGTVEKHRKPNSEKKYQGTSRINSMTPDNKKTLPPIVGLSNEDISELELKTFKEFNKPDLYPGIYQKNLDPILEYAEKEAGIDWNKSEKLSYDDAIRRQDLNKRISGIENNENVKKTLNFTTRSDGSMSYSSKKDYEAAQKFINDQEAEYVKTYTDKLSNDAKYKLDEKISSFVNNKNWEKEFSGMGAQQKAGLMSNLTEAQINMVKKKGLDLENIANWSEEQMGSVVKGLKEAEYMNDVRENLTREFREGVNQRANLAGYNKIASRESSVAAEMSKKMSGFKSVGKLAIGGAMMYGLISALSDSGGQQSNAQLYGQQPLY